MIISVVMTYYNRKNQLFRTIHSIKESELAKDCEIIIVDDGSKEEHKIDFLTKFPDLNFNLIEINPSDKWYVNPCIPFNMGLKAACGEIVIIQNAECMHNGDILKHAITLPPKEYWTYSVSSLTQQQTHDLDKIDWDNANVKSIISNLPTIGAAITRDGGPGWYNHPTYRPCKYHFIAAIHRTNLLKFGYFREEFAKGVGWEDNEFLHRMSKKLKVKIVSNPFGFHQWHYNYTWDTSKIRNNNQTIFNGLKNEFPCNISHI